MCCPSQAFSLDTGRDLQRAGPGQVWKTAREQLCLWYKVMAEKLYQQRERDTRFLFLHKCLIQGVSREKPDSKIQALPTDPLEKGSVDVGFLPWLWSSYRGRRIKSPNMLCIFAKEMRKKLMRFFLGYWSNSSSFVFKCPVMKHFRFEADAIQEWILWAMGLQHVMRPG